MSAKQKDCYQFVYKKNEKVQFPIKTLLASQSYEYVKMTSNRKYNFINVKSDIDDFFKKDSIDLLTGEK